MTVSNQSFSCSALFFLTGTKVQCHDPGNVIIYFIANNVSFLYLLLRIYIVFSCVSCESNANPKSF